MKQAPRISILNTVVCCQRLVRQLCLRQLLHQAGAPLTIVGTKSCLILPVTLLAWPVSTMFHANTTDNTCVCTT